MASTEEPVADGPDVSGDLEQTARLLDEVFHAPQFRDTRYLEWFYRRNPAGPAIETDFSDSRGRTGHIGGIPGTYHSRSGAIPSTFPLNVAVVERARGKGALGRITTAHWKEANKRFENAVALGMANGNSRHYYEKRDGYRVVCPLPVRVCPPVWPSLSKVVTRRADEAYLQSSDFAEFFDRLDLEPTEGWSARWTLESLRWRLGRPDAGYAIHEDANVAVVSRVDHRGRVPFTVVMKTFRRKQAHGRRPVANGAVAAACRYRRSPAAVYAGFSATTRLHGVPLPERLKPAPLYLCVKSLRPGFIDPNRWQYDVFEFLDFDVY